jgi:predicted nucleic acid-binding protein
VGETWVTNASPLIVLAKAGLLALLEKLCDSLLIPEKVAEEVMAGPPDDAARAAISSGWGSRVVPQRVTPSVATLKLDPGETSVLAVALERSPCTAILDDGAARL